MKSKKAIRVLVTAPLGYGGITSMMINIQSHMDRSKVNFDYLVFHDQEDPMDDVVKKLGSKKLVASADHIKIRPLRRILRINEVRKVCKFNHVQILHYNADSAADLTNIIGAKLGGVKYITIHSHNAGFGTAGIGTKILSSCLKPLIPILCDTYWGCSDLAARFLFPKSIITQGKYRVLPNGIELSRFDYNPQIRERAREELGIQGKFVIGHVGRFTEQKNHSFLLDIFKAIYQKDKDAILLLIGNGNLFEKIKKKATDLGVSDRVIFYGASDEMPKMWQAMDVFLMPSLHEGLPVTGIEAQASGLHCIFSDTITKEVDVTKSSEFVPLNQPSDVWADIVLKYKNSHRASRADKLREAQYDIQQTANTVQELYLNAIY